MRWEITMFSITLQVTNEEVPLWSTIHQLTQKIPIQSWGLFGGQMVRIHAAISNVPWPRLTTDADIGVDVRAFTRKALQSLAQTLISMNYEIKMSPDGVSRFSHGHASIDLLAPEGLGQEQAITVGRGYAVQAPGLTQAFTRMMPIEINWRTSSTVKRVPTLLGAIVAKAAACTEILSLTNEMRLRHQQDLVFLIGLIEQMDVYEFLQGVTRKDSERIDNAPVRLSQT